MEKMEDKELQNFLIGSSLFVCGLVLIDQFIKYNSLRVILSACRQAFGVLNATQENSIKEIVKAFNVYGDGDTNKLAYILATARHESNFKPIKEYRAKPSQKRVYDLQNRYWNTGYYGRGFVQLTWERNYKKMSNFLGVDFVANPDLVLQPRYNAKILVYGMMEGSFTRKRLGQYINQKNIDFYNARKVVNGLDRAETIKGYARSFLRYV